MRPRDPAEAHRPATPLELLFDLTFVVAVAAIVSELAHSIVGGHPLDGIIPYLFVFFGIWWAWMNFTWFASAYDCDDALYRILTMIQMGGVLVLAAGVPQAFQEGEYAVPVVGYVIMRIAMVAQWLRAAAADPVHRQAAIRYAVGIALLQVVWVLRLGVPGTPGLILFVVFGIAEMALPFYAERGAMTPWHPHHIAERYGLFTIIVLGESVLAATAALSASRTEVGVSVDTIILGASSLVLLFGLWWVYFLKPWGAGLERRRDRSWVFGYGHYGVFASLAAVGAGLDVAAEALTHHVEASPSLVAASVAVPVAIYLFLVWAINAAVNGVDRRHRTALLFVASGASLLVPFIAPAISVAGSVALVAAILAVLIWLAHLTRLDDPSEA